jgi:hypothetical protein
MLAIFSNIVNNINRAAEEFLESVYTEGAVSFHLHSYINH